MVMPIKKVKADVLYDRNLFEIYSLSGISFL